MKDNLKALIIGAGRIGGLFDTPNDSAVLTHAHAFHRHEAVSELAFCDSNENNLTLCCERWDAIPYSDIDTALSEFKPDIVSICVPDELHAPTLKAVITKAPKTLILTEKPLTTSLKDSKDILELSKETNTPISVNYTRRYDTFIQTLKTNIQEKKYGNLMSCEGIYTKGICHNGSHLIDLFRFLVGELKEFKILRAVDDHTPEDPSLELWCSSAQCPSIFIRCGNENQFSIFEYDFLFESARLKINQFGLLYELQEKREDPVFKGYFDLSSPLQGKTSYDTALYHFINHSIQNIDSQSFLCDAMDAYQTQRVCLKILETYKKEIS
jgi:predicted dehydrogenase